MDAFETLPTTPNRAAGTQAAMLAPRVSLASCIRCYITRSTLNAPPLSERQRLNHFPAMPHCSISWMVRGEGELVRVGESAVSIPLDPILFFGPFTKPIVSYNPGPMDGFLVALMPGALHLLTGIDIASHTDRRTPIDQVFDASWQEMTRRVQEAPDHVQRIALVEEFLDPLWRAARTRNGLHTGWFQDRLNGLAMRAVTSDWAQGMRQLERRVKTWTGLSMRHLRGLRRAEDSFHRAHAAHQSGNLSWAEVAADAGFTDQAHFCRETRRMTGLNSTQLRERILHEESYWIYRILAGEQTN